MASAVIFGGKLGRTGAEMVRLEPVAEQRVWTREGRSVYWRAELGDGDASSQSDKADGKTDEGDTKRGPGQLASGPR